MPNLYSYQGHVEALRLQARLDEEKAEEIMQGFLDRAAEFVASVSAGLKSFGPPEAEDLGKLNMGIQKMVSFTEMMLGYNDLPDSHRHALVLARKSLLSLMGNRREEA